MRLPSKNPAFPDGDCHCCSCNRSPLFSEMDQKNAKAAISLGPVFVNGKQQYVENEALVFVKPDSTIVQEAMQETQSLGTFSFEDGQKIKNSFLKNSKTNSEMTWK